jgi:hypothetical protein
MHSLNAIDEKSEHRFAAALFTILNQISCSRFKVTEILSSAVLVPSMGASQPKVGL